MGKEENIVVFKDTARLCANNASLKKSISESVAKQGLILESDVVSVTDKRRYANKATIIVSKKRSYEAASGYKGERVCVHNFASASNPGGGVVKGSNAQEECLCRCSSLYFCLTDKSVWDGFYATHRAEQNPLHNDDIIYTPDVTVFKSDTASPKLLPEKDWYNVDVITCAAPNLRQRPSNSYNSGDGDKAVKISDKELLALHEKRLRRILDVALSKGADVVILGAFGCGAFANNPEVVARAAKNVIMDYLNAFKHIEFAVYCNPKDDTNYRIFERHMKNI